MPYFDLFVCFTPSMLYDASYEVGYTFVHHMLIPCLTSLQLIHPYLGLSHLLQGLGYISLSCLLMYCWGDDVWFVITCYVPLSSFLILMDGRNTITFFPSLYLVTEILPYGYQVAMYGLCVLHYQSAHLCHPDYVLL